MSLRINENKFPTLKKEEVKELESLARQGLNKDIANINTKTLESLSYSVGGENSAYMDEIRTILKELLNRIKGQ